MRPAFPCVEPLGRRARAAWSGLAAGAALGVAAGCYTGPAPQRYEPALTPRGHEIQVAVKRGAAAAAGRRSFRAELLAVTDTALLVQRDRADVLLVRWSAIEWAYERSAGALSRAPTRAQASRWRLLSRYPQGLPAPMLERLLTERGQPSVVVVGQ